MPLTDDPWLDAEYTNWQPAAVVRVYRFDGESEFAELPNVEALEVTQSEGTDPGSATFRYNLASGLEGAPTTIEEALGTGFTGPLVVEPGDRLVVRATRPDGEEECLFDGLATAFSMSLDPGSEEAIIAALGIGWRLFDKPIGGAIMRDASDPTAIRDVKTSLAAWFNPEGRPNCIPDGYMAGSSSGGTDSKYPTFLDRDVIRDPDVRTFWTLPKAVRYLAFTENPGEEYVVNPDGSTLDDLLVSPGGDPILVADLPVTGKDLLGTVRELTRSVGYGMKLELTTEDGLPRTDLVLFDPQAAEPKHLFLAPRGTRFDPTLFNFSESSLSRDVSEVVNSWTVRGGLDRHEASFVLALGYEPNTGDSTAGGLRKFDLSDPEFDLSAKDKYRLYILDETGEGHWVITGPGAFSESTDPPSLEAILGSPVDGVPTHVPRRRPGLGELLTTDSSGRPHRARLAVSTDFAGSPGVWDGSGTWQEVTTSSWRMLEDRLGVEITDSNPNHWEIGPSSQSGAPFPSGFVRGVEGQLTAGGHAPFWLRLTCVIEADKCVEGKSGRTDASPIPRTIARVIDASDRFRKDVVHAPSHFNRPGGPDGIGGTSSGSSDRVVRDDSEPARVEAEANRKSTEAGVLEGPVSIPRLTTYYKIGDRIDEIEGRGLGFRTDGGGEGDPPVYPTVVGRTFQLYGRQSTTLQLSDSGTDRRRYSRGGRS